VIDGFVEAGLVNLIQNDNDRRVFEIEVTPEAKVIASRIWNKYEAAIIVALGEVSPEKRLVLGRFLLTLTSGLRKLSNTRQKQEHNQKQRRMKLGV
jgi:DNA-binding MarR family transcriptional regulator